MLLFLGGGLADDVLGKIGLGDNVADGLGSTCAGPPRCCRRCSSTRSSTTRRRTSRCADWRYITPGAVFGVTAWILASAGFFFYVSKFSSYSATYGAFAAVVILLIWLYLTSAVLLLGAELNAVVDLRRDPPSAAQLRRSGAPAEGARRGLTRPPFGGLCRRPLPLMPSVR